MAEGTKNSIEEMKRKCEWQTIFSLGGKKLKMNEMSIGRTKQFALKISEAVDEFKELTGASDINNINLVTVLKDYGDVFFKIFTDLFNYVFGYKNDGYENYSIEWVSDNISIRHIMMIVKEIAEQNQMGWLIPFFREKMVEIMSQETAEEEPEKK